MNMMHNMLMGPFWGMVAIAAIGGVITVACFAVMFRYIFRPGEADPHHPKYQILRRDR